MNKAGRWGALSSLITREKLCGKRGGQSAALIASIMGKAKGCWGGWGANSAVLKALSIGYTTGGYDGGLTQTYNEQNMIITCMS